MISASLQLVFSNCSKFPYSLGENYIAGMIKSDHPVNKYKSRIILFKGTTQTRSISISILQNSCILHDFCGGFGG
jgi:hypothetical protein